MRIRLRILSAITRRLAFYRRNLGVYTHDFLQKTEAPQQDRVHLDASIRWILLAERHEGGISLTWSLHKGWLEAYPETTGYIIRTLVDYYQFTKDEQYLKKAIELGDWEIGIQLPEGAVRVVHSANFMSDVFDTGMVLLGFTALYKATKAERFREAAERAGNWLVQIQDTEGSWSNFSFQDLPHVYHSKVGWALYELFLISGNPKYKLATDANLKWIASQKQPNNWFSHMAFSLQEAPYTHTIAYTLQGFMELYKLSDRKENTFAELYPLTKNICDTLISNFELDRKKFCDMQLLPGTISPEWKKSGSYACITGNAQMAIVLLDLFRLSGEQKYYRAAKNLLNIVKRTQKTDSGGYPKPLNGAIPGSYPIWGGYHPDEYPNWGPKFFADALMLKIVIDKEHGFAE
jgi:uncharacterized protein YyaL (SSP411 family)